MVKAGGVDAVRFWAAASDSSSDVTLGDEALARAADALRKIRNTLRFFLGVLDGFHIITSSSNNVETSTSASPSCALADAWSSPPITNTNLLSPLDVGFLSRLAVLDIKTRNAYETLSFSIAAHAIAAFCARDASAQWCEAAKDRLYQGGAQERRSAQAIAWEALRVITRALAPIAPFAAEEIYQASADAVLEGGVSKTTPMTTTIFHTVWPRPPEEWTALTLPPSWLISSPPSHAILATSSPEMLWESLFSLRGDVARVLEMLRNEKLIGSATEAKVSISVSRSASLLESVSFVDALALLNARPDGVSSNQLEEILGVAEAKIVWKQEAEGEGEGGSSSTLTHSHSRKLDGFWKLGASGGSEGEKFTITVSPVNGGGGGGAEKISCKCARCWKHKPEVALSILEPKLCHRCETVLTESKVFSQA